MATSTNKTAAFGVKLIHKCMSKHRYIPKKLTVWSHSASSKGMEMCADHLDHQAFSVVMVDCLDIEVQVAGSWLSPYESTENQWLG
ncbi:hypothetical protein TNCV_64631 [Trichonephila clavipes]|nr:hypothetical protein TNCV_64631 [Trichonephila clavipes]